MNGGPAWTFYLASHPGTHPPRTRTSALGYYVPAPTSPAVGAGSTAVGTAMFDIPVLDDDPSVLYDITGRPRGGGTYDLGCYQVRVFLCFHVQCRAHQVSKALGRVSFQITVSVVHEFSCAPTSPPCL